MAETLYVGPATAGVEVSPEAAERMPWGPGGSIDDLSLPDWTEINANRDRIVEIFNQQVIGN